MAILTTAAVIAAAWAVGGPPWALICAPVLVTQLWKDRSAAAVLATSGLGLAWLLLFWWTADRRLFFPYTMQYAVQLACLTRGKSTWRAMTAGGTIVTLFTAIRILQEATLRVLAVELIVAVAALAAAITFYSRLPKASPARLTAAALGSAMAFAGLAI